MSTTRRKSGGGKARNGASLNAANVVSHLYRSKTDKRLSGRKRRRKTRKRGFVKEALAIAVVAWLAFQWAAATTPVGGFLSGSDTFSDSWSNRASDLSSLLPQFGAPATGQGATLTGKYSGGGLGQPQRTQTATSDSLEFSRRDTFTGRPADQTRVVVDDRSMAQQVGHWQAGNWQDPNWRTGNWDSGNWQSDSATLVPITKANGWQGLRVRWP